MCLNALNVPFNPQLKDFVKMLAEACKMSSSITSGRSNFSIATQKKSDYSLLVAVNRDRDSSIWRKNQETCTPRI